jgi:hypothetical protein
VRTRANEKDSEAVFARFNIEAADGPPAASHEKPPCITIPTSFSWVLRNEEIQ